MQLGRTKNRRHQIRQGAIALCLVFGLTLGRPAFGETIGLSGLMGMPSFVALAIAIGNVNRAMREAAENPMDKWRRQNVRTAVAAMPAAIIGLANDFKAGKLHDKDLPTVQGILGGFVDVNAPDAYQKFLQNPSKDLIPDLGSGFPQEYANGSGGGGGPQGAAVAANRGSFDGKLGAPGGAGGPSIGFDDSAARPSPESAAGVSNGQKDQAVASAENRAKELDSISVGFDDSAKKGASNPFVSTREGNVASVGTSSAAASASAGAAAAAAAGDEVSDRFALTEDPLARGRKRRNKGVVIRRANPTQGNALEADFFGKIEKGEQRRDVREEDSNGDRLLRQLRGNGRGMPRRTSAADPKTYPLKVTPKYWKVTPFLRLAENLVFTEALAQCQGGECGQGEGGGGGGGGGGEAAAQALFGVAAIISAIAPMVVAGIQASADKAIAETNAKTQIKMTQITSDTSKFLSNQQKEIALTQTAASQQIAAQNNQGVTQRLNMQLAELRSAREDQAKREREKIEIEQELNKQRIELANKQADDNLLLARQTLNAQLTQAGLSTGFANSRNSGNRLTVGRSNTATRTNISGDTGAGGTTADAISGTGDTGLAFRNSSNGNGNVAPRTASGVPTGGSLNVSRGVTPGTVPTLDKDGKKKVASRNRLLSSAGRGFVSSSGQKMMIDEETGEAITLEEYKKRLKKRGARGMVGPRVASSGNSSRGAIATRRSGRGVTTVGRALSSYMGQHRGVRGSSPDQREQITIEKATGRVVANGESSRGSDLAGFINSSADGRSFADFRNRTAAPRTPTTPGGHSGTKKATSGRGISGRAANKNAYNPPSKQGARGYSTAIK